ncbi:MAG: SusC/RagA family TonB-linked outer membrane protein [Dysgonomonas sp.]|jgi:TonB-linked SusC/RagA family outer membrane protein|uniref:SusC/RagA family TonB-linked outer membrane protein n=1 Tax=unclassified Dysgonomonas TaxID=2630389 RepID=UPI0025BD4B0D|nr:MULTISPECIES: TonB-dependent receptor [unclassified Dysgonomonas]MDR1718358.1 TonB-dependent receptor [Prevotella sp.]HMM03123.1 TonB-dependent receptor [Dysgonomonas sp.]
MNKKKDALNWKSRKWKIGLCLVSFAVLSSAMGTNNTYAKSSEALLQTNVFQQEKKSVTGVVVDATGEPIIGATIKEKGTQNGTITGVNGDFTLEVNANAILEISYLGFVTQSVSVANTNNIKVEMKENAQSLDEIVITGFGLSQKKATLTGAISTIGSKDIERSSASTVSGALVGKIPGLNTRQTDGRPGGSTQISIRNMGNPLYVIDGIQSDGGQFNNINFNDIESISVLKDASASIYGVRAANGVVVVTTKRGRRNTKNTVSVNGYYGWQSNFKFAEPADAKTYVTKYVQSETMLISQGRMREDQRRYTREEYDKWMAGTEPGYQSFNWQDYIWGSAPQSYVDMNVSGGSEKSNYYVSVGHLSQDATVRNYGGFKRTNAQMNLDVQVTEKLKIGAGFNGRLESRVNPGVPGGDDYWLPRFAVLRNIPTVGPYANGNPNYPQVTSDDKQVNFAILSYDKSGKMTEDWRVMQVNANAEYEIIKGLKAKALVSYYYANKLFNNHEYTYDLYRYDKQNDEYLVDYTMNTPYRERVHEEVTEMTSNIQLAYEKKIGRHSLDAVAGLETIKRKNPHTRVVSTPIANNMENIYLNEIKEFTESLDQPQARMGWVGRVNYNFAEKYLVELSGRYDGSWKFPPNDRWGFFPSASVGWRISEEDFWKESKISGFFDYLKIRGSYGLVGNDDTPNYSAFDYMAGYNFDKGGAVLDGQYIKGSEARGLPVKTLSWLEAKILDVGFDAGFLNNRLRAEVSYFSRIQTGIPERRWDVVIPSEAGFDVPYENLNSNAHKGMDGMISWRDNVNDFAYNVGVNATYARFYDWERYDDRRGNSWDKYRNSIVKRYGYLNWGLEAIGQFQSWEEIANYPIDNDRQGNRTVMPGDIKYKDINGDGVINGMDERPIGYRQDATPVFNYGINLGAAWKGFDFAVDFSGSLFSTYFQQWEQARAFQNNGNSPQFLLEDSWSLSDIWDAKSPLIPGKYPMALKDRNGDNTYWGSTFWKTNVRYLKLRNLEFGYTFPKNLVSKVNISSLRLYVAGSNLFALSNVQGIDPEQQDDNGLGYPTMRVINIGVNLKF